MSDPNQPSKQIIRTLYEDCINTGDLERLSALVDPDYIGSAGERGPEGFATVIRSLRAGIPDIHFTLDELLAEGDRVAVRWTWHGTHTGNLRGFAPSGRRVSNGGIAIYHLKDGRLIRSALQTDRLGVLQQTGVLPEDLTSLAASR